MLHYARSTLRLWREAYRYACWRCRRAISSTITVRTQQGVYSVSTRDGGIGYWLYHYGQYDHDTAVHTVQLLKVHGFLPKRQCDMLDVGANVGTVSVGLILAGEVRRSVAFEPEPDNYRMLCHNVDQNGLSASVICLPMALGSQASTLTMEMSATNMGDHRIRADRPLTNGELNAESQRHTIRVPALPLDEALRLPSILEASLAAPVLLWIDVQGYEGYVFRGADRFLSSGPPTVAEIWPYGILRAGMELEEYSQIVRQYWTDFWVYRRGRLTSYPTSVIEHYLDELGPGGHYENVVFTKGLVS